MPELRIRRAVVSRDPSGADRLPVRLVVVHRLHRCYVVSKATLQRPDYMGCRTAYAGEDITGVPGHPYPVGIGPATAAVLDRVWPQSGL